MVAAKHAEPRTASLERAAGPQLSQIKAGSGDLRSTSRKAFQRCFPSNLPFSCPLLLLPPLLKWLTAKRGGRAAPSSQRGWKTELVLLEPRQPCGGSHRQPINLSHVGSSAAPYDKHSASCCSPLVSSAVFYSLKGGEQRILNEPIPPFVELWSDVLIKATQTEARKDSNSKYCTCSSWGRGGGPPG